MGVDTHGKIKGFISHEEITNYIREKWDINVYDGVTKNNYCLLSELKYLYKINDHSEDFENWYIISGFIRFNYGQEDRVLYYYYSNINNFENLDFYSKYGLKDMVEMETTFISLGYWGSSVEIIKELVTHFGGGWIDENDCDDKTYYPIDVDKDKSFKPVQFSVGEIVAIPTKESFYIGEIKQLDMHLGINIARVDVLGQGEVLYSIDRLKHCDLRNLLVE